MLSRGAVLRLGAMTARAPSKNSQPSLGQRRPALHSEMLSRSERSVGADTLPHTSASRRSGNPHRPVRSGVPARIVCIGTDQVQVVVAPNLGAAELAAVAHRIDQLLDAGYDTVDVVSTPTPSDPPGWMSSAPTSFTAELGDVPGRTPTAL
jgi:hypothetical protein